MRASGRDLAERQEGSTPVGREGSPETSYVMFVAVMRAGCGRSVFVSAVFRMSDSPDLYRQFLFGTFMLLAVSL